jgi:hypothetical protein
MRFSSLIAMLLIVFGAAVASAKSQPRRVQVRWHVDTGTLEVFVNCPDSNPQNGVAGCSIVAGQQAYVFKLEHKDDVTLYTDATPPDVTTTLALAAPYTITGTDPSKEFSSGVGSLFPKPGDNKAATAPASVVAPQLQTFTTAISDPIFAGGKVKIDFTVTTRPGSGNGQTQTKTVAFMVIEDDPWFAASYGIVFTGSRNNTISITKTSDIVSYEKDGKTVQTNQHVVSVEGADQKIRPLQTVVTFASFRISGPAYFSLGFQLSKQVLAEPLIGLTYFHRVRNVGIMFHGGVHFSNETEILPSSGFTDGQKLTAGSDLTTADIPTRTHYHARGFVAFSVKY